MGKESLISKNLKNSGITLIALVITIIVMLILVGVTLSMISGENGILGKAEKAVDRTNEASVKEDVELAISEKMLEYYADYNNLSARHPKAIDYVKEQFKNEFTTNSGATLQYTNEKFQYTKSGQMTVVNVDGKGHVSIGDTSEAPESSVARWTQDKITVTNGTVILKVGQAVTGYTANNVGDGKWFVLGAKDGKLLITTNYNVTTVEWAGQDGYKSGIATLNTAVAAYTNSSFADGNARTIDVDDINRVTGYDPDVAKYSDGYALQWGNEVTYKLKNEKIYYKGSKYPTDADYEDEDGKQSSKSSFTYWTGSVWEELKDENGKNSVTLLCDYYAYYPQTLTDDNSKKSETTINGIENSSDAYNLLFANTSSSSGNPYWLGSQCCSTECGYADFWFRTVIGERVAARGWVDTMGDYYPNNDYGVRPVVSLKSSVKVDSEGNLSL